MSALPDDGDYPTGPINLLPLDDEFWTEQPRTPDGRWAPKEKPLRYLNLVDEEEEDMRSKPRKLYGGAVTVGGGGSTYTAVPHKFLAGCQHCKRTAVRRRPAR